MATSDRNELTLDLPEAVPAENGRPRQKAVTIGAVERFLTEIAFAKGWVKPPRPARERAATIGIVGAGPAGLAAAEELRRLGYGVHVYDRHDRIGGLLIYGIPNFKLDKEVVARRHRLLEEGGVVFHLGVELGRDVGLDELRRRHEAVLLATGVYRPRPLASPGVALQGVVEALDYLTASNRKGLGEKVPRFDSGVLNAAGRDVVVVGGGDTAMDCVRTAVRQGAKSVRCLYRRDRRNMPGSAREVRHAEEEGVEFVWLAAPEAVRGEGTVREIRAHRMHLGTRDGSGRQAPLPVAASHFTLPAGLVILALGFDAEEWPEGFATELPARDRSGLIKVDHRGLMTSLPRVFAAGDVVRGASLVVWAVRDGRDAAASVHRSLETEASLAAAQ